MSSLIVNIEQLFQDQFGSRPYKVPQTSPASNDQTPYKVPVSLGSNRALNNKLISTDSTGIDIWMPIWFQELPNDIGDEGTIYLPYAVISITSRATIVRTPLAERKGSVKEQYNTEDYKIKVKGFFIDKQYRLFPEKDLKALKKLHESGRSFKLVNALTDLFLIDQTLPANEQQRVVLTSFDLPETEGGRISYRPFVMELESDTVFTLEVE